MDLFAPTSLPFPRWLSLPTQALLKRSHEAYRLMMLLEEVSEGFSGKLLERATSLLANRLDRLPSILVELHALAGHERILEHNGQLRPAHLLIDW
jgi:hypothetical protein